MTRRLGAMMVLVAVVAMLPSYIGPTGVRAAMPNCVDPGSQSNWFLGNGISTPGLKGVYSEIERLSAQLCTQGATKYPSWSLAWISLDGPYRANVAGNNIWQGGYAQCPPPTVGSCPYNNGVLYFWSYYAHDAYGLCGAAFNTGIVNEGNTTSGYHFFQVSKVGSSYNFYIDEQYVRGRPLSDIETCWPGVAAGEWQNEMLNQNDQPAGHVSNPQGHNNNQYQNSSGWHNMNRTLGSDCDANSYEVHWHCVTSSSTGRNFNTWDDRVP